MMEKASHYDNSFEGNDDYTQFSNFITNENKYQRTYSSGSSIENPLQMPTNLDDAHRIIAHLDSKLYTLTNQANHDAEVINNSNRCYQLKELELYHKEKESLISYKNYIDKMAHLENLEVNYKNSIIQIADLFEKLQYSYEMQQSLKDSLNFFMSMTKSKISELMISFTDIIREVSIRWDPLKLMDIIIESNESGKTPHKIKHEYLKLIHQNFSHIDVYNEENSTSSSHHSPLSDNLTNTPAKNIDLSSSSLSFQSTIDLSNSCDINEKEKSDQYSQSLGALSEIEYENTAPKILITKKQLFKDTSKKKSSHSINNLLSNKIIKSHSTESFNEVHPKAEVFRHKPEDFISIKTDRDMNSSLMEKQSAKIIIENHKIDKLTQKKRKDFSLKNISPETPTIFKRPSDLQSLTSKILIPQNLPLLLDSKSIKASNFTSTPTQNNKLFTISQPNLRKKILPFQFNHHMNSYYSNSHLPKNGMLFPIIQAPNSKISLE